MFTTRQKLSGLVIAVVLVWAFYVITTLVQPAVENWVAATFFDRRANYPSRATLLSWAWIMTIVGLPVAFLIGLPTGAIILARFERRGGTALKDAACAGALGALILSLAATGLSVILGLRLAASLSDGSYSNIHRWGYLVSENGLLTPTGWGLEAASTLGFVAFGALAGLIARLMIGPPAAPKP